jgi:hypothetical protein
MSKGNFRDFLKRINKDPAMMDFLDTSGTARRLPNENYARELLELFTLGVVDEAGVPNYAQEDIVQIARAFTGWRLDDKGRRDVSARLARLQRRVPERGPKVIFKDHGKFGPGGVDLAGFGEGAIEIDGRDRRGCSGTATARARAPSAAASRAGSSSTSRRTRRRRRSSTRSSARRVRVPAGTSARS